MTETQDLRDKKLITSVFRKILLPALAAGTSANLSGMIDGIVVGNAIGSDALAAVNASKPAMQIYCFLAEIFAVGLANCIAVSVGKNDKKNTNRVFTTGILTAFISAVILTVVQFAFAPGLCRLFANNDTLYPLTLEYYRIFLFSVFFILMSESLASVMRTEGLQMLSGLVLLLPHILNAVLDVLFVYGLKMGLTGAAIATVLGYAVGFLVCCYYFFFKRTYRLTKGRFGKNLADIASVGTPPAINIGLISIKLLIVNALALSSGGSVAMAIMSVLMIAWELQSLFIAGVKQTIIPMVSFYYANGDYHGVRAVFSHGFKILLGSVSILSVILEIFPKVLPFLLGMRDPAELEMAVVAVRIFALFLPIEAFIMLMITYYSSTENKKIATVLSVFQGLVATLPVIYPLVHFLGINGVWISFPVSALVPVAIIAIISRGSSEKFFRIKGYTFMKEFSVDMSKLHETVDSVRKSVVDAGFNIITANKTGLAVEEMAVSAVERNNGKKIHIDVMVRKVDKKLLVTFSDDGEAFDPLQNIESDDKEMISNIAMLQAISSKMEYGRIIGINKTDIILS